MLVLVRGPFRVERVTGIEPALSAWESVSRKGGNAYGMGTFSGDENGSCNERATKRAKGRPQARSDRPSSRVLLSVGTAVEVIPAGDLGITSTCRACTTTAGERTHQPPST